MNFKNLLAIIIVIVVMFTGLGVYHKLVVEDILIQSINKATTEVVNTNNNDVLTKIDNKFKKIDNLTSSITAQLPINNDSKNEVDIASETKEKNNPVEIEKCIPIGYVLMKIENLTRKQRKRLLD